MKLGDVLKKEREKKKLAVAEVAKKLGLSEKEYGSIEAGETPAEKWGPMLANIAINLETPTSRLVAESGRSTDAKQGQTGKLIRQHRVRRELTVEQMAERLETSKAEYEEIEGGGSELEKYAPLFLAFAEAIEQPVFNLFYPCGLPFQELDDYP